MVPLRRSSTGWAVDEQGEVRRINVLRPRLLDSSDAVSVLAGGLEIVIDELGVVYVARQDEIKRTTTRE